MRRAGFTLVEILIVVLIMGMLLTIALPAFQRAREGAYAKSCQDNMRHILTAKERWAMENHKGADDTPDWPDLIGSDKYIVRQPVCPASGNYTIGDLKTIPVCDVGGVRGEYNAHVLP